MQLNHYALPFLIFCSLSCGSSAKTKSAVISSSNAENTDKQVLALLQKMKPGDPGVMREVFPKMLEFAEKGNLTAMGLVAEMLMKGHGTKPNDIEAINWTKRAYMTESPHETCPKLSMIAFKLLEGAIITKADENRSIRWMTEAMSAGYEPSLCNELDPRMSSIYSSVQKRAARQKP